ncbi:hypothetical protein F5Y19DRAFT_470987 [Xylariaceae sp. FL1651]|nr:hypothetical protein F5Y19DRAFT_470987 [Xylariaceae sp. FL1651]
MRSKIAGTFANLEIIWENAAENGFQLLSRQHHEAISLKQADGTVDLRGTEISHALEVLFEDQRVLNNRRPFILIDGLGEFDDISNPVDYNDLDLRDDDIRSVVSERIYSCHPGAKYPVLSALMNSHLHVSSNASRTDPKASFSGLN